MAKKNNFDAAKEAMAAAAMQETTNTSELKTIAQLMRETNQSTGAKVNIRRMPKLLVEKFKAGSPEDLQAYIIRSFFEKMVEDGLIEVDSEGLIQE